MAEERKAPDTGRDVAKWVGLGAGIGSAAIAAALLYYNRDRVTKAVTRKAKPVEHED